MKLTGEKREKNFIHRSFLLNDKNTVEHYQYLDWPDFEVPQSEEDFAQLVTMAVGELEQGNKVLVHCRAGWGRTGTTVAIINALMTIR